MVTRLPKLDLPDLLIEVDRWTGFSRTFQHASGAKPRTRDLVTHLYAAIFAQACNFGLDQMAELAGLSPGMISPQPRSAAENVRCHEIRRPRS